ncbi:MAG: hypothetical protein ABJB55_10915 [Actinomycetota bacterium]
MTTRSATPADVEAALLAATEPGPITGDPLLAHQHAALGTRRRREAARVHPLQQPLAEIATHLRHRVGGDTRTAVHASNDDSSFRPGEATPVGRSEGEIERSAVAPLSMGGTLRASPRHEHPQGGRFPRHRRGTGVTTRWGHGVRFVSFAERRLRRAGRRCVVRLADESDRGG